MAILNKALFITIILSHHLIFNRIHSTIALVHCQPNIESTHKIFMHLVCKIGILIYNFRCTLGELIMKNEISKRLKEVIAYKKISYNTLQQLTGIPKSAIQRYAAGDTEKLPIDRVIILAKVLNVSPKYLLGWEPYKEMKDDAALTDFFPIAYYEIQNYEIGEFSTSCVFVPKKFIDKRENLLALKIMDDSMNHIFLPDSIVIVEKIPLEEPIADGTIVSVLIEDQCYIRRVYFDKDSCTFLADSSNRKYVPVTEKTSHVTIFGKVIWHMNPDNISDYYDEMSK